MAYPVYTKYELGVAIQKQRVNNNESIEVFATKYNITPDVLLKLEKGFLFYNKEILYKVSEILGLTIDELLSEWETKVPKEYQEIADFMDLLVMQHKTAATYKE